MNEKNKITPSKVDRKLYKQFQLYCKKHNQSVKLTLEKLMTGFLNNRSGK